jgi:homopolymeric O-antigen transport system permease protein
MLAAARQIFHFRGLLATLTGRELKARYRGSVLGFFWSLVNPLLLLAVYSFVFGVVFTPERGHGTDPYALFLITGLFPWIWVSTSLVEGSTALLANAGLIRKAVFPAELLPVVAVASNLVHFVLALPILAVALGVSYWKGYPVGTWTALGVPLVTLIQIPMIAGLALGLAALNVHFKDVRDILTNLLTLLFFLTPILYPVAAIPYPVLRWLVRLNPFTPYALAYQELVFYGRIPGPWLWLQMGVVSLVCWALGSAVFERLRETLVEAV